MSEAASSVTVMVGDEVMLGCENIGYPPPVISWTKDRHNIDFFDVSHNYRLTESGSLFIEEAELDDTAHYTCQAENPAGMASTEINLIVHGKAVSLMIALSIYDLLPSNRHINPQEWMLKMLDMLLYVL